MLTSNPSSSLQWRLRARYAMSGRSRVARCAWLAACRPLLPPTMPQCCIAMAGVDFFLMETIASLTVAKAATEAQNRIAPDMERWLSFTLDDNEDDPKFLSGERIESATDMFRDGPLKANAIIFNCAPPEICLPAMDTLAAQNFPGEIGVSPNAFAEKRHSYGAGDKAHIVRE